MYDSKKHIVRLAAHDEFQHQIALGVNKKSAGLNVQRWFLLSRGIIYGWKRGLKPWGRKGTIKSNPELAYVIGALLGDGCLYQYKPTWNHSILIGDKAFTSKFAKKISQCTDTPTKEYIIRSKSIWFVKVGNYELFQLFKNTRENLDSIKKILVGKKASLQFVEGFFDAEGCVKIINDKWRKTPKICLDMANTNKVPLDLIQHLLDKHLGIKARFSSQKGEIGKDRHRRKTCHHLRIYKKSYVKIFFENMQTTKINQRKKKLLNQWLNNGK